MKTKLFYLIFCTSAFIKVASSQTMTDNLKSYKKISYYIDQEFSVAPTLLTTAFTQTNLSDKLQELFSENNIPATPITTPGYPRLEVTVDKPFSVTAPVSNYSYNYAYAYIVEFDLIDMINSKKVILYHSAVGENTINVKNDGAADALWDDVKGLMSDFASDWKATHPVP